jgi:hypothetical protein
MFRNERSLYKRKCDATGKEIISIYSPDKPFKVYDQKYWWSDNWDPMEYGREYNWNKSFFEQWKELNLRIPHIAVFNGNAVNSDYCNHAMDSKNCYLIAACWDNENVCYGSRIAHCKDSLDLYITDKIELCYDNVYCYDSYKLFFSQYCHSCLESFFLYDCRNCQYCFGCTNLRNKQYYIFNTPYSKKEYFETLKQFQLGTYRGLMQQKESYRKLYSKAIHKFANIVKSINVSGDNIQNSKNCFYAFDVHPPTTEDCKFIHWAGWGYRDSYDGGPGVGGDSELLYETVDTGYNNSKNFFTVVSWHNQEVAYCINCHSSSSLFGCIGLRHKQYCILNKQYTKSEYEELVPKIIEHMNKMPYVDNKGRIYKYGEFFPPELSPFCYNETVAQEYFPLTKEQALEQGYSWKDPEGRDIPIDLKTEDIPDHIKDVNDDIIGKIIECSHQGKCNEQCTQAFKIIKPELEFYRKMNLPLPRLCPNCRHYQRIKQRNPLKLWHRKCMCNQQPTTNNPQQTTPKYQNTIKHFHGDNPCPNEFETTYSPDRPEIVYCEKCYNSEVA